MNKNMKNGLNYFYQQKSIKCIVDYDIDIPAFMENHNCRFKKESVRNGYVSKKYENVVFKYIGKFGNGFIVARHNSESTGYTKIEYWIENK